jgi:peptide/nickel transport system permease protein
MTALVHAWSAGARARGIAPVSFSISCALILLFVALAIFAPLLISADPFANQLGADGKLLRYALPSLGHPFGTNGYGQDVFIQTLLGARRTIIIGVVCGVGISILGTLVGMLSGYFGGVVERLLVRFTDFFYAIPFLPFVLVAVHFLGTDLWAVCMSITVIFWRTGARVTRSVVLSLRERQYVRAARAAGAGPLWILTFHILPGVAGIALLYAVFGAAWAILTEATLSFIGLVDPNSVSWGLMLNQVFASGAIRFAWWWVIPPGASLSILLGALFLLARSLEGSVDRRLAE